jgi:uncharacterized protein (TIGR02996 family)
MDLLAQHEAFLRAIYDAPDDDTPRLVYADFLQENGEEDRAAFIRWQCGRGEKPLVVPDPTPNAFWRGFPWPVATLHLTVDQLLNADALRREAVYRRPGWFGVTALTLFNGRVVTGEPFDVLFGSAVFARVNELVVVGEEVADTADAEAGFTTYTLRPVITTAAVVALAQHRGMRRIERLNLTHNDLDNDAARALVKSPYLDNLKRLQLLEGNRLRGKVWQQVIERFGEDVVG